MLSIIIRFLSFGVGFAYPAIKSLRAVEMKEWGEQRKWLAFWIIMTPFIALEQLSIDLLPLYYEMKLLLIIYLCQFNGAQLLYERVISTLLIQHEDEIDNAIEQYKYKAQHAAIGVGRAGYTLLRTHGRELGEKVVLNSVRLLASTPSIVGDDNDDVIMRSSSSSSSPPKYTVTSMIPPPAPAPPPSSSSPPANVASPTPVRRRSTRRRRHASNDADNNNTSMVDMDVTDQLIMETTQLRDRLRRTRRRPTAA